MHSFVANVTNETEKLFLKKKTIFFLVLALLIPLSSAGLVDRFQSGMGIAAIASADFPLTMLSLFTGILLPLYVFMATADSFSGEWSERTLKLVLVRPISRFKIFASKQVSLAIYVVFILGLAGLSSILSGLLLGVKGDLMLGWRDTFIAYGVSVIPILALITATVFIAQFFKSGSGALMICILLFVALQVSGFFFPQISVYSLTSYTDWYTLWLNGSAMFGKITNVMMFLTACSLLFFTTGFFLFDRKEA